MQDDGRASSARERVRQLEERLRRLRARKDEIDAGGKATAEAAQAAAREAVVSRERAAEARERAEIQRKQSAVAHERAAATYEQAAAVRRGDVTEHRIRAAWHREHAEADRLGRDDVHQVGTIWRSTWDSPRHFSCERVDLDEASVVVVIGDIDLDTASELRQTLYSAIRQGRCRLLVDMTDVSFCDSTGLGVLVGALRRAGAENGWIRLVNPSRQTGKVLRITYLDQVFPVHETLDEARSHAATPQEELIARRWQPGRTP